MERCGEELTGHSEYIHNYTLADLGMEKNPIRHKKVVLYYCVVLVYHAMTSHIVY